MPTKTKTKLPKDALVSEILEVVSKQRSKAKKIEILQERSTNPGLIAVLVWNYDPTIESAVPDGEVPYTPNDAPKGTEHTRLIHEYRNLYKFCKGGDPTLTRNRREMLFIQLLEGLNEDEAEIICLSKDKKLGEKFKLTYEVVKQAFPERSWG